MTDRSSIEVSERLSSLPGGEEVLDAVGAMTEGWERLERARGRLYDFHQLMGRADLLFGEAADAFRACGQHELADRIDHELVGRNVLEGRWTFQIVEEFDDTYYETARDVNSAVRALVGGARHAAEAAMKDARRTHGEAEHEMTPEERSTA